MTPARLVAAAVVFLSCLIPACPAQAAWLALCPNQDVLRSPGSGPQPLAHYLQPNEQYTVLRVLEQRGAETCTQVELPVGVRQVLWAGFAPQLRPDALHLQLQGVSKQGAFVPHEVIPVEGAADGPADRLVPRSPPAQGARPPSLGVMRSAWYWASSIWLQGSDKLLDEAMKRGLTRLYISVPMRGATVDRGPRLREFLRKAHSRRIEVWAVLGDPHAVLDQGRRHFTQWVAALHDFNRQGERAAALDGLQLDIEPYLLAGYWKAPQAWMDRYEATLRSIVQAAPSLPLDVVLPFWMHPQNPAARDMLTKVAPHVARITVMNYRTDPAQIRYFASLFLEWGVESGKSIDIALESVRLPVEERRHYRQLPEGDLLRLTLGTDNVLLLLDQALAQAPQGMGLYRMTHKRDIDGSDTSFYKRRPEMLALIETLEKEWQVWPSFGGMAIHGLDTWAAEAPVATP